jgi:MoaA/NifB/PqqE/SkfB family radical SAM enzyme
MKNKISTFPIHENENQNKNIWDADMDIYQNADLIVQTTDKCNKGCPGCYLANNSLLKNNDLSFEKYNDCISQLSEDKIIALRGGEMTIMKDWFEKFVTPALNKKLRIILETNGYFMGTKEYQDVLEKISNPQIFTRISFDSMHLNGLDQDGIKSEFKKMSSFAADAENRKINFGFYSLGMDKNQIADFIKGTSLEAYSNKFHPLVEYDDISAVHIKGKYLKANGDLSDRIED